MMYPQTYKEIVLLYADEYNVDENLIFAVIKAESNFENTAVSHKGAIGVMQIMEETGEEIANKIDLKLDKENLRGELAKIDNNINIILIPKMNGTYFLLNSHKWWKITNIS